MASSAWSGPAGGAKNLGYRSLQHCALPSALGQRRWLSWSCSCSGRSGRSGRSGSSGCSDLRPPHRARRTARGAHGQVRCPRHKVRHNLRCHQLLNLGQLPPLHICLAARLIAVNVRAVIRTVNLAASFAQLATPSAACFAIRPAATGCASSTSVSST